MPSRPHKGKLGKALADQYPNLTTDALDRVQSGKSLFVSRHKLRPDFTPEYARLVLLHALGLFSRLSGLPPESFELSADEKELLKKVFKPKGPSV